MGFVPRRLLMRAARMSLIPALVREVLQRRRVTILLYHSIEPDLLDRHLDALRHRYNFISLRQYLEARENGTFRSLPPRALVLTLDDGHALNYRLLPVLRKHGMVATIFVCTRIVGTSRHFWFRHQSVRGRVEALLALPDEERLRRLASLGFEEQAEFPDRQALTWEEMQEMREWVDFQSHTRLHPILVHCGDARVEEEVRGSREDLEQRGFPVYGFAYPNGNHGDREIRAVEEAGYSYAFTADPGTNGPDTPAYRLKRISMRDDGDEEEALVRASGVWSTLRVLIRGRP